MLITGVRNRILSETNTRSSWNFRRYLIHYIQMFAIMGIIFPIVIASDYFSEPKTINAAVTKKYYTPIYDNTIYYYVNTELYNFRSDKNFFENVEIGEVITFGYTPIFSVFTIVTRRSGNLFYKCELDNVYGWPLVIAGLTFLLSTILIFKLRRKRKNKEYDSLINLGLINAFICIIIIVAVLFQNLY